MIEKLATEVRYSLSEIRELQVLGGLSDNETEKVVRASHAAKHESLLPLKELMARGADHLGYLNKKADTNDEFI